MSNMFEVVILKMRETGMYQFFLPFLLSMALFYGLLRKSKIFGEPREVVSINAVVAIVASFMVWSAPILLGINIEQSLSNFFLQGMSATLFVLVSLLIISMFFPPDLPSQLSKIFNTSKHVSAFLVFGILVSVAILFSSGIINIFLPEPFRLTNINISEDLAAAVFGAVLIIGTALLIVWGGGEKKSS